MRAAQMLKQTLGAVKVIPIPDSVTITFFPQLMEDHVFKGSEALEKSSVTMLDELSRWTDAMRALRSGK